MECGKNRLGDICPSGFQVRKKEGESGFLYQKPTRRVALSLDNAREGWMWSNTKRPFHQLFGEGHDKLVRRS